MGETPLHYLSIAAAGRGLRQGTFSALELTGHLLSRIERLEPALNAFITLTAETALDAAERADEELAEGRDRGALHGLPIAIKDLFDTEGVKTTMGTAHYKDRLPSEDAAVVTKLKAAGAVILGKTNMHELAWGTTSINPHYGAVKNPWDTQRYAGGSSGGSAAAVAAGMCLAALGSDTGASIRQPAHCCGVVGYKPSFGLISKRGAMGLVRSMDHVGPLARSVEDASLVAEVIAGYDERDPCSVDVGTIVGTPQDISLEGVTIGVPRGFFFDDCEADVLARVEDALDTLEKAGATLMDVDVPGTDEAHNAAAMLFADVLAIYGETWRQNPDAFSADLQPKFQYFDKLPAAMLAEAQAIRRHFVRGMEGVMDGIDALACPTAPVTAAPIDAVPDNHSPLAWRNTGLFNLTGQPSISLPCGLTRAGLPVGLMLSAALYDDAHLFDIAHTLERASDWRMIRPDLGE